MKNSQKHSTFKLDNTPHWFPDDLSLIDKQFEDSYTVYAKHTKREGTIRYWNMCAAFDIEDSSFYLDGEKCATMYVWQVAINGCCILGRTWDEFISFIHHISDNYCDFHNRLIIYVHYLNHEFSFIQKLFSWEKVFCVSERSPIYALTDGGIEFRDSYILTGMSLAKVGSNLTKYKINKLEGDLDYALVRGTETPLDDTELAYCVNDVLVLNAAIQEKIEMEGNIAKIPLTNTGYVRKNLRDRCYPRKDKKARDEYGKLMSSLTIEPEQYPMLKRAFAGGFTHANALYVNDTIKSRVDSFDFTSSYPAVMLSEYFPMSKAKVYNDVSRDEFIELYNNKLLIFNVIFNGIKMKDDVWENIISESKNFPDLLPEEYKGKSNIVSNNGRIVSADHIALTITNIDFGMILKFYDFESLQIGTVLAYEKGYLPKPIIEGCLEFYGNKTKLKDVVGKEAEYARDKGMINCIYGCMVTDIIKDTIEFIDNYGWSTTKADIEESIYKYNDNPRRFLYYPWGIFITSYARRNLFTGILEFGEDYIYSDTDSIKCLNKDSHMGYIEWYNKYITKKVKGVLSHYGIDESKSEPETVKGVKKPIGVWDCETDKFPYTKFKTLGAKRYMYTQDCFDDNGELHKDVIHTTIAGLSKKAGAKFIAAQDDPYDFFSDEMTVDREHTGKLLHTYIDDIREGYLTDYLGNRMYFKEMTAVHLEPTSFSLSETEAFKDYLKGYKENFTW